jgi:hypothetical protein
MGGLLFRLPHCVDLGVLFRGGMKRVDGLSTHFDQLRYRMTGSNAKVQ